MIHKISEFCDKIDSIKVKFADGEIDNMIQAIQADCLLVASDKQKYEKKSLD